MARHAGQKWALVITVLKSLTYITDALTTELHREDREYERNTNLKELKSEVSSRIAAAKQEELSYLQQQ